MTPEERTQVIIDSYGACTLRKSVIQAITEAEKTMRLKTIEECAKVAEECYAMRRMSKQQRIEGKHIAAAIRAGGEA